MLEVIIFVDGLVGVVVLVVVSNSCWVLLVTVGVAFVVNPSCVGSTLHLNPSKRQLFRFYRRKCGGHFVQHQRPCMPASLLDAKLYYGLLIGITRPQT